MSGGRTLVVTGASTGFGRAIAEAAVARGWRVCGTVRKEADAESLRGAGITPIRMDLALPDTIAGACSEIEGWAAGRVDAVVHNAGSVWPGPVEVIDLAELRQQFEVNLFGHVDVTQRLLPAVRAAGGRMLFVSSDSTSVTLPMTGPYAASKRALEAIAEALAQETAGQGIHVIVVAPGPYATSIWDTSIPRGRAYEDRGDPRLERYRVLADRVANAAVRQPKGDARDLAAVVLRALEHPRPAFRYVAPFASRVRGWVRWFTPTRLFHRVSAWVIDRIGR